MVEFKKETGNMQHVELTANILASWEMLALVSHISLFSIFSGLFTPPGIF